MLQKRMNEEKELEIDIGRLLRAVMDKAWLVALVAVVCAIMSLAYTKIMITPLYKSTAMFYVNNSALSVGDASLSISSGDLSTSRKLVDSYIVILNTRETINEVIEYSGSARTYNEVRSMVSAGAVNETEIFSVTITSPDPVEAEMLADAFAEVLPDRIGNIIAGSSAEIVDSAVVPTKPSSPSYSRNVVLGFGLGFLLMVGLIVLRELFDTMIRSSEDIAEVCGHPILTSVPDMNATAKASYTYSYDRDSEKKKNPAGKKAALFGKNVSFSTGEAYKLLRTKLQFSFADDRSCHVIGISSSLSGEGKSLTSINLAYTLSQLGKKVILIDCDMRRPTLAEKLNISKKPGLSSCLTGQVQLGDLIQNCGIPKEEAAFHVISAGQNPPNPVELLSSARMQNVLTILKNAYDYVILDLPPVGEVSDALAVAKQTDGMLLVVRQNVCDRYALNDTVRQFQFIEAKILGLVFNCVNERGNGLQKYYKGYYKRSYGYYRRSKSDSGKAE